MSTSSIIAQRRAGKIPEDIWERHRGEIQRLYIKEKRKLEGEEGVVDTMARLHDFIASKAQYESRFRKWGFRRNLKRTEWRQIINATRQRARVGKHSQVHFDDILIAETRIAKEITRYGLKLSDESDIEGPNLPLPKGVMIDSPARSPLLPVFTRDSLSGWMSPIHSLDSFPLSDSRSTLQSGTQNTDIRYDPLSPMDPETNVFTLLSSADRQALAFYADPTLPNPDEFRGGSLPLFIRNYPEPFSWAKNSNWSILQKAMHAYQEIMKLPGTGTENLNAILYPELGQIAAYSGHCADSSFPKLIFFSILNGTAFPREIPLDKVSRWFRSTSPYSMMLFLESVPAPFSDMLAERIFQVAIEVGDAHIIDEILQRGLNPNERICGNGQVTPLQRAISLGHFEATKMLLRHITNTGPYFIPGLEVIGEAYGRPDILKILIAHGNRIAGCLRWLQAGILKDSIHKWYDRYSDFDSITTGGNCIEWIINYFLRENIQDLPAGNPDVSLALSEALSAAIQSSWYWAAEIILDASFFLETHLPLEISDPSFGSILSYAYQQGNKELVHRLIKIVGEPQVQRLETLGGAANVGTDDVSESSEDEEPEYMFSILRPEVKADFCNAISNGNFDVVHRLFNRYENSFGRYEQQDLLRTILETIDLSDEQALTRILGTRKLKNDIMESVYIDQLRSRRVEPVSALLFNDSLLASAVPLAIDQGDFSMLENFIFKRCLDQNESFLADAIKYRGNQLVFRGLLYYGIQRENFSFMKWLIDAGAHLGELCFCSYDGLYSRHGVLHTHPTCGINFWPSEDAQDASQDELPSLLEVAVGRNNKSLIKFLLAEGADGHDSFALRTAVILGHGSELLTMLMDASENARPQNRRHYGSSALCEAIHTRNADSVRLLAGRVDINGFEPGVHGSRSTPLGEAIKTYEDNGIETVRLLLKNGGDPDTLVTYNGFGDEPYGYFEKSFLGRMTAMLAAIDTNHLPMVQLLVDHGADVNLPPNFGVTRTPLQRAAERGNFAILQYLLEKGAEVDGPPAYSGGTALQLAAIEGYVGIATLLLEKGADPNFRPAYEDGRTAFEGAAEWGRVDMMLLLMKWGADLRADSNRQYDRALNFAERNGQMASKRFVERLYTESQVSSASEMAQD